MTEAQSLARVMKNEEHSQYWLVHVPVDGVPTIQAYRSRLAMLDRVRDMLSKKITGWVFPVEGRYLPLRAGVSTSFNIGTIMNGLNTQEELQARLPGTEIELF